MNTSHNRLKILAKHISPKIYNFIKKDSFPVMSSANISDSDIIILPRVKEALERGDPVVALESTIISHGMPYPQNVETARLVEETVLKNGAIPATIAILHGKIHVGLGPKELELLGRMGHSVRKCSRRDIALAVARKEHGATTVSGTMLIADMVGIKVFVTGGIGGVHRGAEETFDISADLTELGRTPVCVVCAGVKSILDIPKTLEYLETQGVSVCGYQTNEFPSFFTRKSGCKAPITLKGSEDAARLVFANETLGIESGIVIAVPVPKEQEAHNVDHAIEQALTEARNKNILGKEITPFLLARINELTKGESLRANIALVLNNAKVGSQIAKEYSKLCKNIKIPIFIGGATIDLTGKVKSELELLKKTSNPGSIRMTFGGVARNVINVLNKLNIKPLFVTAVGKDEFGKLLKDHLQEMGLSLDGINVSNLYRTAIYNCVLNENNDLDVAIADMDIFENAITPKHILKLKSKIRNAPIVFLDGNVSTKVLSIITKIGNAPIFFEPTSVEKSKKAIHAKILHKITYMKPNEEEIIAMVEEYKKIYGVPRRIKSLEDAIAVLLDAGVKHVLLSRGKKGLIHGRKDSRNRNVFKYYKAYNVKVVNTTGCGDSFVGGFIYSILKGYNVEKSIIYGLRAAALTIQFEESVAPIMSEKALNEWRI